MKPHRLLFGAAFLIGGCAVGPDFVQPQMPVQPEQAFVEALPQDLVVSDATDESWWQLFDDPVLDRLVLRALDRNTDVRVAVANLARVRAALSEVRSQRLPSTDASAQYSRQRAGVQPGLSFQSQATEFDNFSLGFDLGYEVDLFGRVSRSVEAARADTESARADVAAARIAIAAETARTYAQLCSQSEQLALARETLDLQRKTLELTERQLAAGRGTRRDVARLTLLTEQIAAQIPQLDAERRASLYALATLTGDPPAAADEAAGQCMQTPRVTRAIPVGDAAALLARRPDVARAERQLAADTARIGIATAELYPSIRLLGSVGLGASDIGDLGNSASQSFSLGPLISWSFPNISVARARIRQAEAQSEASLATFDGAVLRALQETEQALARYAGAVERNASLRRAQAASEVAADLTQARYRAGGDSFLDLVDAQRGRAEARSARAQSDGAVAEAQVALFRALGGGWVTQGSN